MFALERWNGSFLLNVSRHQNKSREENVFPPLRKFNKVDCEHHSVLNLSIERSSGIGRFTVLWIELTKVTGSTNSLLNCKY